MSVDRIIDNAGGTASGDRAGGVGRRSFAAGGSDRTWETHTTPRMCPIGVLIVLCVPSVLFHPHRTCHPPIPIAKPPSVSVAMTPSSIWDGPTGAGCPRPSTAMANPPT